MQVYFTVLPVFQLERHILDIFYKIQLEMDDISYACVSHATGIEKMSEDKLNDLHTGTDILILMHPERKDAFETVQLHTFLKIAPYIFTRTNWCISSYIISLLYLKKSVILLLFEI